MNTKKTIIVIFVIICVSIMAILLINSFSTEDNPSGNNNSHNNPHVVVDSSYVVIDNYSSWKYSDESWSQTSPDDISKSTLKTYIDNTYYGMANFLYINNWSIIQNDKVLSTEGKSFIGVSNNLDFNILKYSKDTINENDLNIISDKINYELSIENLYNYSKISDINGNSVLCADNLFTESTNYKLYFSYCFENNNGVIKDIIYNEYDTGSILTKPYYYVYNVFDIDNEKYILISKGYFSLYKKSGNLLFKLENSSYNKVIED